MTQRAGDLPDLDRTALGIELGSTNIKACLIGPDHSTIATGSHLWENELVDGLWTYSLEAVWAGVQGAVAALSDEVERRYGTRPTTFGSIGVSAMMHGYLAFDEAGELLVPFRTWRNTNTAVAAEELTETFGTNIPLRWSVAHLYQAILDDEPHLPRIASLTTLAGYVHRALTGRHVLGVGDASGVFPIDAATGTYDARMLEQLAGLVEAKRPGLKVEALLPEVVPAGTDAGRLTTEGAALLDPTGTIRPGILLCPPEGDAGTGMVATNSVAQRTGNVSAGTSIFAMVVLEEPLATVHHAIDIVTTPSGDPVAMVHCNNGASELDAWAGVFGEFAAALGLPSDSDAVFGALLTAALKGSPDGGGLLAYNYLAGEPITGLDEGRPLFVRTPGSRLDLAGFARAQVYGVFGTLALGMRVLAEQGVEIDAMFAHGGLFRTAGVAQRLLAAAIGAPVAVGRTAGEGGSWGIAVLAAYARAVETERDLALSAYLAERVFGDIDLEVVEPDAADLAGFKTYLDRYEAGLEIERAAVAALDTGAGAAEEGEQ
ncbi:sugar (pentulose or hexulose) kinase [Nocardioides luteus]|uniref:ATPase n=1 Tax=Nocardioides luteus TaxID=1844 RepID=A0ABQ5T294_9ACTN|nr:FGGY-family carbohydrate kinase [Nocardioides luteus]MDR7311670.1 sugar (pentulose or hexulose) kinase [Nocardioides luteus]GGR72583.1 ATPase [Nocardioides luteus]GLJ70008.1 ATPase [Nocardioides luteus]